MKVRDILRAGSIVETLVVLNEVRTLCLPRGTIGRITGEVSRQGQRYWVVSFPLPQADATSILLYSEEHPDLQILYQTQELRKVRGKHPRPLPLMVARFVDAGYALYEVTRDERLSTMQSRVELGVLSFADLPVQAVTQRSQVQHFCTERGWHLLYKEGDLPYHYKAELTYYANEEEEEILETTGTVLAATALEAHQQAIRVLLRDYPPEEHFSGHEQIRIQSSLEVIQHPAGSWGIRRSDGKILMRRELQGADRPRMSALVFATAPEAEAQRLLLEPLTAEQRQERGFF